MRRRMSALLVGIAALSTTLAVGQPAARAGTEQIRGRLYTIQVLTGALNGASGDANVRVYLDGSAQDSGWMLLANMNSNAFNFKTRRLSTFGHRLPRLGTIERICVRRSKGSDWYLEWVQIGDRLGLFNVWIPRDTTVCRPTDLVSPRTIKVQTGPQPWAGTKADVYGYLIGSGRPVGWMRLDKNRTDDQPHPFEPNALDTFELPVPEMGVIQRICVSRSTGSNWYLSWVEFGGRLAGFHDELPPNTGFDRCPAAGRRSPTRPA
jgi:PLAT/LH2 domain